LTPKPSHSRPTASRPTASGPLIPRYQRILFWILLLASVIMAAVLIRLREQAADRIANRAAETEDAPLAEPIAAPAEAVILLEANDLDGAIAPVTRNLPLPAETGARARVLLRQLFADYAAAGSKHPLAPGPGVEQVFFMAGRVTSAPKSAQPGRSESPGIAPARSEQTVAEAPPPNPTAPQQTAPQQTGPQQTGSEQTGPEQTAIVSFTAAFAQNHPSGIEAETLTLLSIVATLHQNFPTIREVRFLVDGQPKDTLAGHADLTRTYLTEGESVP
jgi:hypothetical protein